MGKSTDFRYNTGETKVPWAAVGENYNAADLMEVIRFLMQGEGPEYDQAINAVWEQVKKLDQADAWKRRNGRQTNISARIAVPL